MDLGLELLLGDHALGGVLEVEKIVFEFVILQVLHDIGCKFCTLELSNSDGPVWRYQQLVQNTVKLHQFFQLALLGAVIEVFH